jgi:hypothetical protein
MKPERGLVQIVDVFRLIERGENQPDLFDYIRRKPATIIILEERFKPLCLKLAIIRVSNQLRYKLQENLARAVYLEASVRLLAF